MACCGAELRTESLVLLVRPVLGVAVFVGVLGLAAIASGQISR
jgi:hypothetical protein